jgi:hypothetical protein
MKTLNPEGSLKIDTSADRDGEIEMVIENPKPSQTQSVYIGKSLACDIIRHLSGVFGLAYFDSSTCCETCKWWVKVYDQLYPAGNCTDLTNDDSCSNGDITAPKFCCCHWEGKGE